MALISVKGEEDGGHQAAKGKTELVLGPLPTHCSWAQKSSLVVAVPHWPLVPVLALSSSPLAQFLEVFVSWLWAEGVFD